MPEPRRPAAPLAPAERSLRLSVRLERGSVVWGATWSVVCGAIAAQGFPGSPVHLAAAWLLAVPILGSYWAPILDGQRLPPPPAWIGPGRLERALALARSIGHRVLVDGFGLAAALVVGLLLGPLPALAVVATFLLAAGLKRPEPTGWRRSALEIFVPAWIGWTSLGGPVSNPVDLAVTSGLVSAGLHWLSANGVFLAVLGAFTAVHYGTTAVTGRADIRPCHRTLVAGYLVAVAALFWAGAGLWALSTALLFVLQWPHQAAFRHGKVRWHLAATQGYAMAAMLAAVGLAGRW